jgi:hypothetical protein
MCSCAPDVAPACCVQVWMWSPKSSIAKRFAWVFVMFELGEVRDGQPQVLVRDPVLSVYVYYCRT